MHFCKKTGRELHEFIGNIIFTWPKTIAWKSLDGLVI